MIFCFSVCELPSASMTVRLNGQWWTPTIYFVHCRSDVTDDAAVQFLPLEVDAFLAKLSECIGVVSNWMRSNRLQLNSNKTEVLWYITGQRQDQIATTALSIHCVLISMVTSVRHLGIFIHSDLVMRTHVQPNSIRMLHCASSTMSDHQLRAESHVPVIGGCSGVMQTQLRKGVLISLPTNLVRCLSRCRIQLHGWSLNFHASIILQMHCSLCTSQSASSARSP